MSTQDSGASSDVDLVGVALLPDVTVAAAVVEFARRWDLGFGGYGLDGTRVLPHVSLHQVRTAAVSAMVDRIAATPMAAPGSTRLQDLVLQPPDWMFLTVETLPWMVAMQSELVGSLEPFVRKDLLKPSDELVGYGPAELRSYRRHGYRYVGDAFLPHFTLGRSAEPDGAFPVGCREDFDAELRDLAVQFTRLVVFRAAAHGTIGEIVFSRG